MRVILCKAVSCKFGIPCALLQHIRYEAIWLPLIKLFGGRGSAVVKVLRYKSEGRWFDFR